MQLDKNALNLISLFKSHNHAAYAVGGCVRDSIMGRSCNDVDICVSCTPDVTVSVLEKNGIRYVETGLKHGTVTAVVDRTPYEITTFRTDGDYTDSRHPDNVTFVSTVDADLARRDFTINAMAYAPDCGIVDLFGGRRDINEKIIRTVGDPDTRFSEDALRILRALRFSSTLGFEIEKNTAGSIMRNRGSLSLVARERITAELKKLLLGDNVRSVLITFEKLFCELLSVTSLDIDKMLSLPPDFALRLAALCDGSTLVLSRLEKHRITTVRKNADRDLSCDLASVRRLMFETGADDARDIFTFNGMAGGIAAVDKITELGLEYTVSHLDISGTDLINAGIVGRDIKSALDSVLFAVIDGKLENKKQKILDYISDF